MRLPVWTYSPRTPKAPISEALRRQVKAIKALSAVGGLLDALPHFLLILNQQREIVYANHCLVETLGVDSVEAFYGHKPGDVLDCIHAFEDGGCGKTESCQACGAARAVGESENGASSVHECRVLQHHSGRALDLRITATPFELAGEQFTVLVLTDIAEEKRRQSLERLFFHDLMNTAGCILGYAELLQRTPAEQMPVVGREISQLIKDLADEVHAHRDLLDAERQDLQVQFEPVNSREVLNVAVQACRTQGLAHAGNLQLDAATAEVLFPCDRRLLLRVLNNMVKNALEASSEGSSVTAGCQADSAGVDFWVHNDGVMPREVQLQVFQRSFSTKGKGRGLGTYSIKLLTERYLNGQASFVSTPETGTVFTVRYPRLVPLPEDSAA